MLWKMSHYRIIEEYRKKLKSPPKDANPQSIKLLSASFRSFLTESTSFYLALINKLKDAFELDKVNDIVCKRLDVYATEDALEKGLQLNHLLL